MTGPNNVEELCADIAKRLYANADALAIEAGKYEELAAMLVASDTGLSLESLLGGLVAKEPAKWESVLGDLTTVATRHAARGRA